MTENIIISFILITISSYIYAQSRKSIFERPAFFDYPALWSIPTLALWIFGVYLVWELGVIKIMVLWFFSIVVGNILVRITDRI